MAEFKDLIVNETDGKIRYNIVDRNGAIVSKDVNLEVSSNIVQAGDTFGALELNCFLEKKDSGEVNVKLDGGTF
ncbi:MAG: hypothetical protein WAX04_06625 [Oscillospiraceae bacterium]